MYAPPDLDIPSALRHRLAIGTDAPDDVIDRVAEQFDVDPEELDLSDALDDRERDMVTWPAITDCDRLDRAFATLDHSCIVARQHYACCRTCGTDEIHQDVARLRYHRRRVDGYAFYHQQDTDHAIVDGVLHVRFDGSPEHPAGEIGERVVAALRAEGLDATWDRDPEHTIQVAMRWQRRRPIAGVGPAVPSVDRLVSAWCEALQRAVRSELASTRTALIAHALEAHAPAATAAWIEIADDPILRAWFACKRSDWEAWREAWRRAPYDETLVELIARFGIADPIVRELAIGKCIQLADDLGGSVAPAWVYASDPRNAEQGQRLRELLECDSAGSRHQHHELGIRAALWASGDEPQLDRILADYQAATVVTWNATPTLFRAARSANDVHRLYATTRALGPAVEQLLALQRVDEAQALARAHLTDGFAAVEAGWLAGLPRDELRAALFAKDQDFDEAYTLGLLTDGEREHANVLTAVLADDPVRAIDELLAKIAATIVETNRESRERYLAGGLPDRPARSAHIVEGALAAWTPDLDRQAQIRIRRHAKTLLDQAAHVIRAGRPAEGRELLDRALAPLRTAYGLRVYGLEDRIVIAWAELGITELHELSPDDTDEEVMPLLSPQAVDAHVRALHPKKPELARARLGAAISRANTAAELTALLPALLVIAPNSVEELRAAIVQADDFLATFRLAAN
ncbi:MAG: hypothetical protein QM831_41700 [Kofleriaceae bacterium]